MSKVLVTESHLEDIADAIRGKNGTQNTYTPGQMAAAITAIPSGSSATLVSKTITANGTYDPADDNADGYSGVTVNVSGSGGLLEYVPFVAEGITTGYVNSGNWIYSTSWSNLNNTMYRVEVGKRYLFILGNTINRFRAMYTTTDVRQATADVAGTEIINETNPTANESVMYTPSTNGYVVIYTGNIQHKVYGYEWSIT